MTYHAMFSLYIMTGLLALITFIEFSLRWSQSLHPVTPFSFSLKCDNGF